MSCSSDSIVDDLFAPIPINKFHQHVLNHHKLIEGPCDHFDYDMEVLSALAGQSMYLSMVYQPTIHELNRNRYTNVLPNSRTRVRLTDTNHISQSHGDYVNASLVPSGQFDFPCHSYIATQAPLPSTLFDFYAMCWEQQSNLLLMLTKEKEKKDDLFIKKADRYWPHNLNETMTIGPFTVRLIEVEAHDLSPIDQSNIHAQATHHQVANGNQSDNKLGVNRNPSASDLLQAPLIVRRISITKGSESRILTQIHYVAWPDHGAPDVMHEFDAFFSLYRSLRSSCPGPVLIHCSAGIGRTGTFAVIDLALDSIVHQLSNNQSTASISIPSLIHTLRQSRAGMVQSKSQYVFAHTFLDYCITNNRYFVEESGQSAATQSISQPISQPINQQNRPNGMHQSCQSSCSQSSCCCDR